MQKIDEVDLYNTMIEDCRAIIVERIYRAATEVIVAHGEIGERIVNDPLYKKYSKQHKDFLEKVARGIGISYSEVCRSIQFYQKFKIVSLSGESWDKFEEGKSISWSKIKQKYLPQNPKIGCEHYWEKIEAWKCRMCKKVLTYNPVKLGEVQEEQLLILKEVL